MDSRKHRRVPMRLPARLRWSTPFGQKIELCQTINVSRGGLLVFLREAHSAGVPLWITFPFDASLSDGQPETLASVVRCEQAIAGTPMKNVARKTQLQDPKEQMPSAESGQAASPRANGRAPRTFAVAIRLEEQVHAASNGNAVRAAPERRSSPRRTLTVPIRVRPEHVPWFEEAMSLDFSKNGMRFRSQREYAPGDSLRVAIERSASTPWSGSGEFRSMVVRVAPRLGSVALDVGVCIVK
jgi:hypothetical protein